jgi:hypothetical protein
MPKFNHEAFQQVVNETWNSEGINVEVRYKDISFGFRTFTYRKVYGKQDILDFPQLAEECCQNLKDMVNSEIRKSEYLTISPWEDGQHIKAYFRPLGEDGKYWKGGIAFAGIKVLYSPWTAFEVGDDVNGEAISIPEVA